MKKLLLVLLLVSSAAGKQNGYMETSCNAIGMASGLVIHLENWPGSRTNESLKLAVIPYLMEHDPDKDAIATLCSTPESCIQAGASVRLRSWGRKRAAGTFSARFDDGRKIEGTFAVRVRKQPELICE